MAADPSPDDGCRCSHLRKHHDDERGCTKGAHWMGACACCEFRLVAAMSDESEGRVEAQADALMAGLCSRLIGALWELPGFEHTEGNSVVDDVRDYADRLRERVDAGNVSLEREAEA